MSNSNNNQITNLQIKIKKSILANIFAMAIPVITIFSGILILIIAISSIITNFFFNNSLENLFLSIINIPIMYLFLIPPLSIVLFIGAIIEIVQAKKYDYIINMPDNIIKNKFYSFFFWIGAIAMVLCTKIGLLLFFYMPIFHKMD